jgi:hypothetical protein
MRKERRSTIMHDARTRRSIVAALGLAALIAAAIAFFPRGLRGPETVASDFLSVLISAPDDLPRQRRAGHLDEGDDPLALADGLPTRVAFTFLAARGGQGAVFDIDVVERRPDAQDYVAVLSVSERDDDASSTRRFAVTLRQTPSGDWRVSAVSAVD